MQATINQRICVPSPRPTAAASRACGLRAALALRKPVVPQATASTVTPAPTQSVTTHEWLWRGNRIRYHQAGTGATPIVLVHGFASNADHWRKNTCALGGPRYTVYALDLLGHGMSDKPDPAQAPRHSLYSCDTWTQQLTDFIEEVASGQPAFVVCNSAGGLVGLAAALARPDLVRGVQLLNITFRHMHVARLPPWRRPLITAFQWLLHDTPFGRIFFEALAKPEEVRKVLSKAYGRKEAVTDELVNSLLAPAQQPGAMAVFLDITSNSEGPLPEELLARVQCPVSIVWGKADAWQRLDMARAYFEHLPAVKQFIVLPGVGHCPQDEAPELVNPLIRAFCDEFAACSLPSADNSSAS